jgi:hypothetical protein
MPTKTGQWVYMEDGSVAQQVYAANAADVNSVTPVDIQSRLASTIQTHSGVVVAPSSTSYGANAWVDTDGFTDIAVTLLNDASVSSVVDVFYSNDGSNEHGSETVIASGTPLKRAGSTSLKARYIKVRVTNSDAGAAHTMNAWAYLKA